MSMLPITGSPHGLPVYTSISSYIFSEKIYDNTIREDL